ncbi:MAG: nicotinate-nucleotide--dimethylbenzimidazole phosphoribosyltransferase [Deltaproteobacteria bacterium]|nr:nicotinate-nucleotide--dimethylbenzimidazole phosphoribosyltransferase [Deltaproteobacteria bacterium]MBW2154757.1 nicotinate-nucleotide--dimethylbenzimidazole phosphoribosyltransferase [Deltaproteobacteria bacterium]
MLKKIEDIIAQIEPADKTWVEKAQARTFQLVMPPRALGRLHEIAEKMCGIRRTLTPCTDKKAVLVMAGDHGVVEEGISAYPQEVTAAMVHTFLNQGAGINAISRRVDAEVWVVDMGIIPDVEPKDMKTAKRLMLRKVARGTANFSRGPAMTRKQAIEAIFTGFDLASELFRQDMDLIGTGDMGIGNTTPAAAIGTVVTGESIEKMVGPGTGVSDQGLNRKREVIRKGIEVNRPDPHDGIDILTKVGGFEIGGIAGIVLAGAFHKRPVVIDGFISTAGALVAYSICPKVTDYLIAGHRSEEPGHGAMLSYLQLEPILDLGMRLGEGTGAALAMGVIDAAVSVFRDVFTFSEAGVPNKD